MHQQICTCQPSETNGHSEQAQTIADLYQALSNVLVLVVKDRDFSFPEQQYAIRHAKSLLASIKL